MKEDWARAGKDVEYDVSKSGIDFQGQKIIDFDNKERWAVGTFGSLNGEAGILMGAEGEVGVGSVRFLGGDFANIPYPFYSAARGGYLEIRGGIAGGIERDIFAAYNFSNELRPSTFPGLYTEIGISIGSQMLADLVNSFLPISAKFKEGPGLEFKLQLSGNWVTFVGGVSISGGIGVNKNEGPFSFSSVSVKGGKIYDFIGNPNFNKKPSWTEKIARTLLTPLFTF